MEAMIELALRRQFDEAQRHALADPAKAGIARIALQAIIDGTSEAEVLAKIGKKDHRPKVDLAEERRAAVERFFRMWGHAISVPKPAASNTTINRWKRKGRELFYRPASVELTYEALLSSHGQAHHWTVANTDDRAKIVWEIASTGYWFLVEMAPACPRVKTSWNDLTALIRLLCLEEYAIAYCTHRDLAGRRIDIRTWCWLRTRFGQGALRACYRSGGVWVRGLDPDLLLVSYAFTGGRAVEVVKNAA